MRLALNLLAASAYLDSRINWSHQDELLMWESFAGFELVLGASNTERAVFTTFIDVACKRKALRRALQRVHAP